jgi:hypothetical protein
MGAKEIIGVDLFNPEGKHICRINQDDIGKASYRGPRAPICGVISTNFQSILLGFETGTIFRKHSHEYTFGVYDTKNGRLLWRGNSNALKGIPVMETDKIFALEAKNRNIYTGDQTIAAIGGSANPQSEPTSEIVLVKHTKEGRIVICDIPLRDNEKANKYSSSQDQKNFVLVTEGNSPRLLIIPIHEKTQSKDILAIQLKQTK